MTVQASSPLIVGPTEANLGRAVDLLRRGGVVAYPTETLYGLGGRADSEEAIARIYRIKGRAETKPLPLIAADIGQVDRVAVLAGKARELAEKHWPGPLTLILPASVPLPRGVDPAGKIAVRVSPQPIAAALAAGLPCPLISTSANASGSPGVSTAADVLASLGPDSPPDRLPDLIIDAGPAPGGAGSTIVEIIDGAIKVLREGALDSGSL